MLLVLLIMVALSIVPFMIDVEKHGRNHILRRSGQEILQLPVTKSVFEFFGSVAETFNATVAALFTWVLAFVSFYIVVKILEFLVHLFSR
jgi:hypothetical protein